MAFYIERTDSPHRSGFAAEDIPAGTLVQYVGGEVHLADMDRASDWDGVADAPRSAEYIADFDHETGTYTYLSTDPDPDNHAPLSDTNQHLVPFGGSDDGDYSKVRTITDDGGASPDISDGDVVGFVDMTVGDAPSNGAGRIVEEGYTNGATTFDRGTGNFVAIGKAHRDGSTNFDEPVRVRVDDNL